MDSKTSGRKTGQEDSVDVDVDNYFLPGGILDLPSHEEDMIGGSLLDEIGGVGNVTLVPPKQMSVSRIVGSEPRASDVSAAGVTGVSGLGHEQSHRPPNSIVRGDPTRLSVEGTNPMAKEFTPSSCSVHTDVALEVSPGGPHRTALDTPPSNRVFSAAVGSEVKTTTTTLEPPYRGAVQQRQPRKPSRPAGSAPSPQPAVQSVLGERRPTSRHQPVGTTWPTRKTVLPAQPGPTLTSKRGTPVVGQVPRSSPSGLPPRGIVPQRTNRVQGQGLGAPSGLLQRRERSFSNRHEGSKPGLYTDGTWDDGETTKADAQSAGVPGHAGRVQKKNRNQGSLMRHVQPHEQVGSVTKVGTTGGRVGAADGVVGRTQRGDQDQVTAKGQTRSRTQKILSIAGRASHDQALIDSSGQETSRKVSSGRQGEFAQHSAPPAASTRPKSGGEDCLHRSASSSSAQELDQEVSSLPEGSPTFPSSDKQPASFGPDPELVDRPFVAGGLQLQHHVPGRWAGASGDRNSQQKENSGLNKSRSRKKEERYTSRSGPKHILGKEPIRAKVGPRPRLLQRLGGLVASMRSFSFGLLAVVVRTIAWYLNRLHLVGRLLAALSFGASSGVFLFSVVITSMSWLFLLWLRVHSLALQEVTGSIHVAVCFLFPYSFKYIVSLIDEWAPHWLPACLWYSFLMQMFCSSNHLQKHSMSSHLVPALRALLPVAFLCEVPSGRSYLLALGGSELLLLSFTLAAVRLRCLFSPIFLFSWSSQVFAIATFGSSASLQYGQLLVSLASLHAVSMVDVMLNSRLYHARYRAGMSLTSGFRSISPPSHKLLR